MAGIYIHIPFCKQACTYCDFHFSTTFASYRKRLIKAMQKELVMRSNELPGEVFATIYFGGGTPSLLTEEELSALLTTVKKHYTLDLKEVTLEANPDDITPEKLLIWKNAGIDRLSIGVQSFMEEDLKWMKRAHNAQEAHKALRNAKTAQFKITLDLIYGLPNRSLAEWNQNITTALSYNPEHISAYCLTVEDKTALAHLVKTKKIPLVSDDEQAKQFEQLIQRLAENGYEQYEISNFAKDGAYAIHNSNYWLGVPYLGIGPSAHSYDGTNRSWNIANNQRYIQCIETNEQVDELEELTPKDQFNEYVLTRLRTKWGISLEDLNKLNEITEEFKTTLDEYCNSGAIILNHETAMYCLTPKGKLLADKIAGELFVV